MSYAVVAPPCLPTIRSAANRERRKANPKIRTKRTQGGSGGAPLGFSAERKEPRWQCVQGCGACCKLDKGPSFATPEEIFEDPSDIQLYRSMVGPDGWCIHYDKPSRTCSIYSDRPYFCRVEPEIFDRLYGIDKKKFNREACSCCTDTIKEVYGSNSKELDNFNQAGDDKFSVYGSGLVPEVYTGEEQHGNSCSFYDDIAIMPPASDECTWFGADYGVDENAHGSSRGSNLNWDVTAFCESIFGNWR